jgi:membrane protein YdbS with pleckstrin-like domain
MRCSQCGFEAAQGAMFCARCGTRILAPRPQAIREYAIMRVLPSWWHFLREILLAIALAGGGLYSLAAPQGNRSAGALLLTAGAAVLGLVSLARRYTSWSLTSDRLIERSGMLASRRREMELADLRSIEVDRSLKQRALGLGNVTIASAASAEFLIRMHDVPEPEHVAEILRQARLKRLG